jgi:amino acid transporter
MSKKLRGSMSVYKETKEHKDFVMWEMFILSVLIGLGFQSWGVWLFALFILCGSMGTKIGLIIGWVVTIVWVIFIALISFVFSNSPEFSLVAGILAGITSWYVHDCGNLYWRDFSDAEWW